MDDIKYVIKERRKIFYIDVGDMTDVKMQKYIDEIKEKCKQFADRKIFYIDVGDTSKEKIESYIKDIVGKYKQREGIGGA